MKKLQKTFHTISLILLGIILPQSVFSYETAGYYAENSENMLFIYKRNTSEVDYSRWWSCGDIGEVWHGCNKDGNGVLSLGNVTDLCMDAFFVSMWKKVKDNSGTEWGDICSVTLYYTVNDWTSTSSYDCYQKASTSSKSGDMTTYDIKYGDNDNDHHYVCNLYTLVGSEPGNYILKYKFSASVKQWDNSDTGCPQTITLNNGGSHYQVSFTFAGFKSLSSNSNNFGTVNQGSSSSDWSPTFSHYGTPLSLSNCTVTTNSGSGGSVVDYFTVKSVSESGVTVAFTPKSTTPVGSELTAYLHITDAHGKSITITLKGTAAEGAIVTEGDKPLSEAGPQETLYGFIQRSGCVGDVTQAYRPYGFYYIEKDVDNCSSVTNGSFVEVDEGGKTTGDVFSAKITSGLKKNTTYFYKPYIVNPTYKTITVSNDCYTFTTKGDCDYPQGDEIEYTIDASKETDLCNLVFPTFDAALSDLKSHNNDESDHYWWDSKSDMLKKNVTFKVVKSTAGYGTSGERVDLSNINKYSSTDETQPTKRLTIKPFSATEEDKPLIWGLNLANSRWVTVEGMDIKRDAPGSNDGIGHSCILIGLNEATNNLAVGKMTSTDIIFKDCLIEGNNFCCIHANGVNGLYMENCNLNASCDDETTEDTFNWGASIKFMNCKNIKLIRNNFKGAHANNIFAQNTQYMLVMENVFWNDNAVTRGENSGWNYKAIIRLINYGGGANISNIGMYYNTMYVANNAGHSDNVDFLTFGGLFGTQTQTIANYDLNTIEFKYNNCYSYDLQVPGKSPHPFGEGTDISASTHITDNNFWSKYDKESLKPDPAISAFSFGNNILTPYVSLDPGDGMVCETAPNTPEGIIIKGTQLNSGSKITKAEDITGLGAEEILTDRLYAERGTDGEWSYGAYQTTVAEGEVSEIIWNPTAAEDGVFYWDNRSNWFKRDSKGKLVPVNCVDKLSENLKVIIPEVTQDSNDPQKQLGYPTIIPWDDPARTGEKTSRYGKYGAEAVFAGADGVKGVASAEKFAKEIVLKSGGGLLGVENLNNGTRRYNSVTTNLTVPRKKWILVGSVISNAKSDNFYKNHMPHVYMQKFSVDNSGEVAWNIPFTDREQSIESESSFAVFAADQYGPYKSPAQLYYTKEVVPKDDERAKNAGNEPITFSQTGDFAYDHPDATNGDGYATITLKDGYNILNNAYPAVINVTALGTALTALCGAGQYSIKLFDYDYGDWRSSTLVSDNNLYILPQSGFIIQNRTGSDKYLKLTPSLFASGKSTNLPSNLFKRAYADASVILRAENTTTGKGSVIGVFSEAFNEDKTFNASSTENAELYIVEGGQKYSVFGISDMHAIVPLGIRNKSDHSFAVRFIVERSVNMESVILEDRGVEPVAKYDLLSGGQPVFTGIPSGDTNGRFFLNINYAEEEQKPDITTDVIDHSDECKDVPVQIFAIGRELHVVAPEYDSIQSIMITDLAGKTFIVKPSDTVHSINTLQNIVGAYIITAVSEKGTTRQKVLIK